ncbi:MipA/OmpV family protein [Salmonella enterica subsp. enterica serovar Javiana]|nr:MipA/OmpV family protein [Salmonella enterica subsp. enterica serovar Javiana]ECV1375381.1 MipA/OmpV family protein [Salmonella enterica subsp. enterica serovar Javiana]EEI9041266.1 MipA/OmpV family protein [Salmonella enterica subsp. enterica serovar Javiana]
MAKIKLLAICMLSALSLNEALAESNLTLGAGVGVVEHPYKNYDAQAYLFPAISYDGDHFWFRGLGGGYYLWNDTADTLSVTAYWQPLFFKPSDSDNCQLRLLDKRKSTMMAGISWSHHTQYGFLRTTLAGDVLDNSNGIVWDAAWLYRYVNGDFTLTPGVGIEWNSQEQNEYYYGVSRKESAHSGLQQYKPDDGWAPYLEVSANYRFAGDWGIYGTARYTRLSDEVTDSPMVDKSWNGLFSTGISYRF